MSESSISQLLERLDSIEISLKEICASLLGKLDGKTKGLIHEFQQCKVQVEDIQNDVDKLKEKYDDLAGYKREVKIYATVFTTCASAVLVIAWELVRHYFLK